MTSLFHSHRSSESRLVLLDPKEQALRLKGVRTLMAEAGIKAALIRNSANIYYMCGRVFSGYIFLTSDAAMEPLYFVRRPNHLEGERVEAIRKPEDIPAKLQATGLAPDGAIGLELDAMTYALAERIRKSFGECELQNISPVLRQARSVKTPLEQDMLRASGHKQTRVYENVPRLYQPGMTDIELQIEIERASRLEGCLGLFRVAGDDMELYMANVLTGDNADTPSPYDFAMGGGGLDPSIPVGANGSIIEPGKPVMVDANGNYTGYMTDMTRCYSAGRVSEAVEKANEVSRRICREIAAMAVPGAEAKALYDRALAIAREEGLEEYFMGWHSHAGFVGHGVGIEVNELPVLAPRSRDILQAGNVIAVEPKFVLPEGDGAVGVENTYIVREDGPAECITLAPEHIVSLV